MTTSAKARLSALRRVLRRDLGKYFIDEARAIEAASRATFLTTERLILAIARPKTTAEVALVLRTASRYAIPVHPTSRGRNWGYGSKLPHSEVALLLDLSRMTRIRRYDAELGQITVEPGVTFEQVVGLLERRKAPWYLNTIGGAPDSSPLANALERGHGVGLYRDRATAIRSLEVVLPTGDVLRTGLDDRGYDGAFVAHPWGFGPAIDKLFTQSSLGVVTSMTFVLAPTRKFDEAVLFDLPTDTIASRLFREWRRARAEVSFVARPVHRSRAAIRRQIDPSHVARTIFAGAPLHAVANYSSDSEAAIVAQRSELFALALRAGVKRVAVETSGRVRDAPRGLEVVTSRSGAIGQTTWQSIESLYRTKRTRPPRKGALDLDRDRCGILWSTPILPFHEDALLEVTRAFERVCVTYGCEPDVTLYGLDFRVVDGIFGIVFDRDDEGADQRALAAHQEIEALFRSAGIPPYRLGIQHDDSGVLPSSPARAKLLSAIKAAVDPAGILSPSRPGQR